MAGESGYGFEHRMGGDGQENARWISSKPGIRYLALSFLPITMRYQHSGFIFACLSDELKPHARATAILECGRG